MKISLFPESWLSLCLLLASLGLMSGCAMSVPAQNAAIGRNGKNAVGPEMAQRGRTSKYPSRTAPELSANSTGNRKNSPAGKPPQGDGNTAAGTVPIVQAASTRSTDPTSQSKVDQSATNQRQLAARQSAQAIPAGQVNQANLGATAPASVATNLSLSDSPVPNPLRTTKGNNSKSADVNANQRTGRNLQQPAVQTVGYQEELPIIAGEQIPKNPENITRLAMLEEPVLAEPAPTSVLESEDSAPAAEPMFSEIVSAPASESEQQLPWDEYDQQQEVPIVQSQGVSPAAASPPQTSPAATAQGHYQQGTAVYGQVLNEPQQTASQRAIQLLDENQRLREEMKAKLKDLENAQAKLKQQDELWARARQEFLEVRGVVDNLTRENSLLKMQIEKLEGEKVELARQYQSLMQTVEQTLDDLLLKALAQPPEGNRPATTPATTPAIPPAAAPGTQPPAAPPIVTGQQASALLKSSQ